VVYGRWSRLWGLGFGSQPGHSSPDHGVQALSIRLQRGFGDQPYSTLKCAAHVATRHLLPDRVPPFVLEIQLAIHNIGIILRIQIHHAENSEGIDCSVTVVAVEGHAVHHALRRDPTLEDHKQGQVESVRAASVRDPDWAMV
jgi:hypothetical protein